MSLRKDFLLSILNNVSKLCYILYRKTDKTSLDFCTLNRSGLTYKTSVSSIDVECTNLKKITVVINDIHISQKYTFNYISSEKELVIFLNSSKLTKSFLLSLSSINSLNKVYINESLFEFYLELIKTVTRIITSNKTKEIETNINFEIACKDLFLTQGIKDRPKAKTGKVFIISTPDLKKLDSLE